MWSILSHTESFINESEAWCETVSSKTAVNINDDGRHLSKQRQVSFLIYGNFHRFEISFFPLWSYLHGDTRDPVTLCATVQTCSELIRREKKYFGNACPQLLATVTGTKSNLTGCWYENGFHKIKYRAKMMLNPTILNTIFPSFSFVIIYLHFEYLNDRFTSRLENFSTSIKY